MSPISPSQGDVVLYTPTADADVAHSDQIIQVSPSTWSGYYALVAASLGITNNTFQEFQQVEVGWERSLFVATETGRGADNPSNPRNLSVVQAERSVMVLIEGALLQVSYAVAGGSTVGGGREVAVR